MYEGLVHLTPPVKQDGGAVGLTSSQKQPATPRPSSGTRLDVSYARRILR